MMFLSVLFSLFNLVVSYDKETAAFWAQDCAFGCKECPNNSSCGAAYFTTHALTHGNWGYGYESECIDLWSNFKNGKYNGWTFAGTSETDIYRGDVVIMNNGRNGDASHCCIGTGNGLVSCHGPGNQNVRPYITGFFDGYINAVYTYVATSNTNSSGIYSDSIISCSPYDADACNCVYYARDRQKSLPSGLTTCDDKKSKVNSHTPAPGCVLFRTGDPTYCHAAYVTKVSNGNVYYDQANWTPCKCSSDYLSTSSSAILGYWCP